MESGCVRYAPRKREASGCSRIGLLGQASHGGRRDGRELCFVRRHRSRRRWSALPTVFTRRKTWGNGGSERYDPPVHSRRAGSKASRVHHGKCSRIGAQIILDISRVLEASADLSRNCPPWKGWLGTAFSQTPTAPHFESEADGLGIQRSIFRSKKCGRLRGATMSRAHFHCWVSLGPGCKLVIPSPYALTGSARLRSMGFR